MRSFLPLALAFHALFIIFPLATSFQPVQQPESTTRYGILSASSTTVEPPTREEQHTSDRIEDDNNYDDDNDYPDMEYLIDSQEAREFDDPFHILLMGSTFDKPKISVNYVAGSLEYVLGMPATDARELSAFARDHGMSCLGCWPRAECLQLGRQLQMRDLVCRVVPFAEGGHRGWQAKDAGKAASSGGESFA